MNDVDDVTFVAGLSRALQADDQQPAPGSVATAIAAGLALTASGRPRRRMRGRGRAMALVATSAAIVVAIAVAVSAHRPAGNAPAAIGQRSATPTGQPNSAVSGESSPSTRHRCASIVPSKIVSLGAGRTNNDMTTDTVPTVTVSPGAVVEAVAVDGDYRMSPPKISVGPAFVTVLCAGRDPATTYVRAVSPGTSTLYSVGIVSAGLADPIIFVRIIVR